MTRTHSNQKTINTKPYIIAICGASGSGKSLFTQNLVHRLQMQCTDMLVLQEDRYYRAQDDKPMAQRIITNYDHPNAFEHELLKTHIEALVNGQTIDYPEYCYQTHTRKPETQRITTSPIIIIEGIMLLAAAELQPLYDLTLFVDTPLDVCLLRRMLRDTAERGRTIECVAEQYQATVKPMYHQFIEPNRGQADMIITQGGDNQAALNVVTHHVQSQINLANQQ
ncbi:MAG: uridine kinase [Glaciecola sp.]|nr:uridine kinase [Glaciecola sp.]